MYKDEDIKKIVEDAIKNMDPNGEFFKNVVSQITEQIKNEQKIKLNNAKDVLDDFEKKYNNIKIPKDTKTVIHDLNKKADTYLTNNKSLDEYISNRDKFMGVFNKITKDKVGEEIKDLEKNYHDTKNVSYTSYTSGWEQTINEHGNPVGYLYFDFNSNNDNVDIYKQILDYYSILNLHSDEWTNWDHDDEDCLLSSFLNVLIDEYTYHFEDYERKMIDLGEDDITSFIYTKLDDDLKMFSIYILNYSRETNKLYDFVRFIITLPEEANDYAIKHYYDYLKSYFNNETNIKNLLEDYLYTYINRFKVNQHFSILETDAMYIYLQGDIIHQIIDKIDSESKKVEFKITKEDTPEKTNSILDELGIPHDGKGNVEIPITDGHGMISDKFISNRMNTMGHAFDFHKYVLDCNEKNNIGDTETKNKLSNEYMINTGNEKFNQFLSKAINDGYIEVEVISPEHVYLNINGTIVFMKNPYGSF